MMSVQFLFDTKLLPDDGSKEMLDKWDEKTDSSVTNIYMYPDAHYKKGARIVNGILIRSKKYIYPACLGTENCGYTFGKIENGTRDRLIASFERYSKRLKAYEAYKEYSSQEIKTLFLKNIEKDMDRNKDFYAFLGIQNKEELHQALENILSNEVIKRAQKTLGSLGGGNHFFEIHEIMESKSEDLKKGDFIFALHSDSINVGWYFNVLYSNLSEMGKWMGKNAPRKVVFIFKQLSVFYKRGYLFSEFKNIRKLMFSQNDFRTVDFNSRLGKDLLLAHATAAAFGEMNRTEIINNWRESENICISNVYSHSHDSIRIQKSGEDIILEQRRGVQYLGEDSICFLPSAMGNYSYILNNLYNEKTFFSTNHGTGRTQDKHIAKNIYTEEETLSDLNERNIYIYRIGKGNIAEQNLKAFKEPEEVLQEMEKNNIATRLAKTMPIAIIKG